MIVITSVISLDESELEEKFVRSSGPGGQNVNKVATAVQLRFDAAGSPSLPQDVKQRLLALAGRRATEDGVVVIDARGQRTQEQNRREARQRLIDLIRRAAVRPKTRRRTRPSAAARRRRLDEKRHRGETKRRRGPVIRREE